MEKTIAAISTAPAPGGIGMVRISGKGAFAVADRVFRGVSGRAVSQMKGYTAQLGGAFTRPGSVWTTWWPWCTAARKATPGKTWWSSPAMGACM